MIILPYIAFTVKTDDPPAEVRRRLAAQVGRHGWFRFSAPDLLYAGAIWDDGFKVIRLFRSLYFFAPDSLTPVIRGSFEARPAGTVVHVTMRLRWDDAAFLCCWCVGFVAMIIAAVPSVLAGPSAGPDLLVVPIMFVMLGFVMFAVGMGLTRFRREAALWRIELVQVLLGPDKPSDFTSPWPRHTTLMRPARQGGEITGGGL